MIKIDKGQVGFFDISLHDKINNFISTNYDFIFENEVTSETVTTTLADTSTSFERYSRFFYTDNLFDNCNTGFYRYTIEQNGNVIATGRMFLYVAPQSVVSYDGYDKSVSVYDK
jgi:hypothetical protein